MYQHWAASASKRLNYFFPAGFCLRAIYLLGAEGASEFLRLGVRIEPELTPGSTAVGGLADSFQLFPTGYIVAEYMFAERNGTHPRRRALSGGKDTAIAAPVPILPFGSGPPPMLVSQNRNKVELGRRAAAALQRSQSGASVPCPRRGRQRSGLQLPGRSVLTTGSPGCRRSPYPMTGCTQLVRSKNK